MPLARIDVPLGLPPDTRATIGAVVFEAMRAALDVPDGDHFQVIAEHGPGGLVVDPGYLGISRTSDAVLIQVTLNEGRTLQAKKAFYKAVADGLHERARMRREDVVISLVEARKENWSFGNGEAQYG